MPISSFGDIYSALDLKNAVEEVDQRHNPISTQRQKASSRKRGSIQSGQSNYLTPVFNQNGKPFAETSIRQPGWVLAINKDPQDGTIIEYQTPEGNSLFGIVTHLTKSWEDAIFVRTANSQYANQLKQDFPNTKHLILTSKDLHNLLYQATPHYNSFVHSTLYKSELYLIVIIAIILIGFIVINLFFFI